MTREATMLSRVRRYLAHRRALGFDLSVQGKLLEGFARYVDALGYRGPATTELAVRWATLPGNLPRRYPDRRIEIIRPFARYEAAFDDRTQIPPKGILGRRCPRPSPYIYSAADIVVLIAAAGRQRSPGQVCPSTFAHLFGLLASCGLRISEALALRRDDVDFPRGTITIRQTKFRKTRIVALHPTTTAALQRYALSTDLALGSTSTSAFFVTRRGKPVTYDMVHHTFLRLRKTLGPRAARARIHDIRHTFACRRLVQWYAQGVDVANRIAALSTYMGHVRVSNTYWYLSATPDLLAVAGARFGRFAPQDGGARR